MPKKRTRANGEGSVYKDANGKWRGAIVVGYDDLGKPLRKYVYGHKTQDAARDALDKLKVDNLRGMLPTSGDITIGDFLERWLSHKAASDRSPKTIAGYRHHIEKHILTHRISATKFFGDLPLEKLTPLHLEALYKALRKKPKHGQEEESSPELLSARMVRFTHVILHGALGQAVRWQLIPRNVADAVEPPRSERDEMKVWTPGQVRQFLDHCRAHRLYGLFYLAVTTGMRRGELLGLRWENVSLEDGKLWVRESLIDVDGELTVLPPKTKTSRRVIELAADTVEVLRLHRLKQEEYARGDVTGWNVRGLVFPSELGGFISPSNLNRTYKALIRGAGVPDIRLHDLRHTAATLLFYQGKSAKLISDRLGHTNVAFTLNTYTHVLADMRQEAALSLAELTAVRATGVN